MRGSWVYSLLPSKCRNSNLKLAMPASVHALPNLVPILTPPTDALQIMHSKHQYLNQHNINSCEKKLFVTDMQFNHGESA